MGMNDYADLQCDYLEQEVQGLKCEVSHWKEKYHALLFEMEKLILEIELKKLGG